MQRIILEFLCEIDLGVGLDLYAIIEIAGKQYKVAEGDVIYTEKVANSEGKSFDFPVLAMGFENRVRYGSPYLNSARVSAEVLKNGKKKKIVVFTYKPKKNCKRKMGHRQGYTKFKIVSIKNEGLF